MIASAGASRVLASAFGDDQIVAAERTTSLNIHRNRQAFSESVSVPTYRNER